MKCRKFEKKIYSFIRGEIDENAAKEMKKHLTTCSSCEKKYRMLNNFLETSGAEIAGIEATGKLNLHHIPVDKEVVRRRIPFLPIGLAAAANILLIALLIFFFRGKADLMPHPGTTVDKTGVTAIKRDVEKKSKGESGTVEIEQKKTSKKSDMVDEEKYFSLRELGLYPDKIIYQMEDPEVKMIFITNQ